MRRRVTPQKKQSVKEAYSPHMDQTIRLMFQDEAGFGRINKPKMCWCPKGIRPSVPCHHIREYEYLYGAVEPMTGENFFLIMPYCNTNHMNAFLRELSAAYPEDYILQLTRDISIHAPREGSDPGQRETGEEVPISIHAPREGSDNVRQLHQKDRAISIHAPREGSDTSAFMLET